MKLAFLTFFSAVFLNLQCGAPKVADVSVQQSEVQQTETIKEQVQKGAFVVDVRTPQEFAAGSVEGAVNIPLSEVSRRIPEFQNKPSVIVFCRSGKRSGQAKQILEDNGIKNVTNGINVPTMEKELR